jgi:lipopolysaccharide exporter
LFLPAAFGTSALFNSFTSVFARITSLSYELAIMLPEDEEEAANILGVSLLLALFISLLIVPFVWLGQSFFLQLFNATELSPYIWFLPPTVFFVGSNRALNIWNGRAHQFGRLSKRNITNVLITVSVSLIAGFLGYTTAGSLIFAILWEWLSQPAYRRSASGVKITTSQKDPPARYVVGYGALSKISAV